MKKFLFTVNKALAHFPLYHWWHKGSCTILIFCTFTSIALGQMKEWGKDYVGDKNDYLRDMIATSDGGFLAAGTSSSGISGSKSQASRGSSDYWIVKANSTGAKVWDKTFGGLGYDTLSTVVLIPSGGYLLGGTSNSSVSGDKTQAGKGGNDYWIIKVDVNGNKLWDKTYGGNDRDGLESIIATPDGGFLLGGNSHSGISGDKSEDIAGGWIIKIDMNGTKLWDRSYDSFVLRTIVAAADGGFLLGGVTYDDYSIIKINGTANIEWRKTFGGTSEDELKTIVSTPDGGYLLGGDSRSDVSGNKTVGRQSYKDYWIIKISSSGGKIWERGFASGEDVSTLEDIILMPNGGFLIGGSALSYNNGNAGETVIRYSHFIVNTDSNGNDRGYYYSDSKVEGELKNFNCYF